MESQGELPSLESLRRAFHTFRDRFGPDVLRRLDGEHLLDVLKGPGKDGLVYWLEFKNDEELPSGFGSIAGGSALKYGIYRRRETGAWTAGTSQEQREISTDEALAVAQAHRDQLVAAASLLDRLPAGAEEAAYVHLQRELARVAPDIQDSGWAHKYLSLVCPDKLDNFHSTGFQRHNLIKTLQIPNPENGRYSNAGRFVEMARELEWHPSHLYRVMNTRHGVPHKYWRIGTRGGDSGDSYWDMMRRRDVIAIGWAYLGDLSTIRESEGFKEALKERLSAESPKDPRAIGRAAQQIAHFANTIATGDYVMASDGAEILGIGKVTGEYQFDAAEGFPHLRPVEWLSLGSWQLPTAEGLRTTVFELRKNPANLVAIERRLVEDRVVERSGSPSVQSKVVTEGRHARWTGGGTIGRVQDVLDRKRQVILYGPPGTGKTYWAERSAGELSALWNFARSASNLPQSEHVSVAGGGSTSFVRMCTFHPGYGYEDFIEGYRPAVSNGSLRFERRDGIFKSLCDAARQDPALRHYLIIDEINRGDIPRIFGELLTLLETDKRGKSVLLPLSGETFSVPDNVFVIGTMNTADRSIALLDAALRRRFGFVELMPDSSVLGETVIDGIALGPWLSALNQLIVVHVGRDGRNLQVGHSYFLNGGRPLQDLGQLARVLQEDLLPLLEEYCYDDWTKLEQILGTAIVDSVNGRFRAELFARENQEALIQAILAVAPDVSASAIAVAADVTPKADDADDDEGDDAGDEDAGRRVD